MKATTHIWLTFQRLPFKYGTGMECGVEDFKLTIY